MARRALTLTAFLLGFVACAQDLTVFAASSLTESFQSIAAAFEGRHEGVHVLLNFAGSSALALQIVQGAPADVFASANPQQMQKVVDEGLTAADPQIFAENRLVVIVPASSGLSDLLGLARPGIALVLAAPEVPVGAYARQALASMDGDFGADFSARVMANVVSEEPNTRQVAAKVELGEADAAVVYATDAAVTRGDTNDRHPLTRQRDRHVSDRGVALEPHPRARRGLHRLRSVRRGASHARATRLPPAGVRRRPSHAPQAATRISPASTSHATASRTAS